MPNKSNILVTIILVCLVIAAIFLFKDANKNTVDNSKTVASGVSKNGGYSTLKSLEGKKIANLTGSVYGAIASKHIANIEILEYNSNTDRLQALDDGKVDAVVDDAPIANYVVSVNNGRFKVIEEPLSKDYYAPIVSFNNIELADKIDPLIRRLKQDGTMGRLEEKWFKDIDKPKQIDIKPETVKGVLRIATCAQTPPFAYISNGNIVGYDIELMYMVAKELGMGIDVRDMEVASMIPSVISGKSDVAIACMTVTDERKQAVRFLEPNYEGGIVMIVKDTNYVDSKGFIEELQESWYKNFVHEDRYKLILKGLSVTLVLSIGAAIIGTLIAFAVCMMRRSQSKVLNITALVYIRAIQGTPIVVLLMLFYYVVFANLHLDGVYVAILAFAINFSAYVAEMMRTGIEAVDKGQIEAGKALGFSDLEVFKKIVYPQSLRHILPVYKGEFISMVKMTSVVGYIAVQDLTKMSDIIRSRTYDAFFPLITTALIYFLVAYVFIYFLNRLEASVDPKRRNRALSNV